MAKPKKASKSLGRPPKSDPSPETMIRRERRARAAQGKQRPRGRPASDTVWHAIRLTVTDEMFNRIRTWRSEQTLQGSLNETCRVLLDRGLSA